MAEVGRSVSQAYGADWDLVLAGIILHDIGKLQELGYEGGAGSYTRDGNLIGHIARAGHPAAEVLLSRHPPRGYRDRTR